MELLLIPGIYLFSMLATYEFTKKRYIDGTFLAVSALILLVIFADKILR